MDGVANDAHSKQQAALTENCTVLEIAESRLTLPAHEIDGNQYLEEVLNVGEIGPYICTICQPNKTFKNSTGFRNHVGWKHSSGVQPALREAKDGYKCDVCGMSIRGYGALSMHKWKKHGVEQMHKCDRCDKTFGKLRQMNRHMADEHGIQMFKCEFCSAEFKSREGWKMHRMKMHVTDVPSQVCYICGKSFKMPYQLKNHIKLTHKTVRDFICHLCTRAFKGCGSLRRHLLTFHSSDRLFTCDICESKFKTRADLTCHRRLHFRSVNPLPASGKIPLKKTSANGVYSCQYCSKAFTKSLRCKAHEKLFHECKKPGIRFACIPCDKVFKNQYYLIHHVNNKHRRRNHRCQNCGRLYSQLYLLRHHAKRCSGAALPKPYSCDNCQMKFSTKTALAKHVQSSNRCCHKDIVGCVILVDDGMGNLSFDGQIQGEVQELEVAEPASFPAQAGNDDVLLDLNEFSVQGDGDRSYVHLFTDGVTMDESSIPVSAEELCVIVQDAEKIDSTNNENQ